MMIWNARGIVLKKLVVESSEKLCWHFLGGSEENFWTDAFAAELLTGYL
jgi:hypothetical protein